MTVKAILSAKGGDVISIEPTATLEAAVKTLAKHRIGALLVLGPDRRVIGILSERDIVRVLGEQGADVLAQPLAQVMTRDVVKHRLQEMEKESAALRDYIQTA